MYSPQLLQLGIIGTGATEQKLSRASALFIHELVYLSPRVYLHVENTGWEEHCDRDTILEGISALYVPADLPPNAEVGRLRTLLDGPLERVASDLVLGDGAERQDKSNSSR